ncbi:unnamed protein product [Caenorhabditis brenneri]
MTMKHWIFFPILVKEEVLKNMDLSDRLSFSKCSKKCRRLLSRVPNHMESFIIPHGHQCSVDDFSTLITCRKSTVHKLKVAIETAGERDQVNQFLLKLNKVRSTLKVKFLVMGISPSYSEMHKKSIDSCDPSFIESIEIERIDSQEIYDDILKTPQWENSKKVLLNLDFDGLLEVSINDFLHFKFSNMKMEELSVDDAWKLVQNFVSTKSQDDHFDIRIRANSIQGESIRQKIEAELIGDWKNMGSVGGRYLRYPENSNRILAYIRTRNVFYLGLRTLE